MVQGKLITIEPPISRVMIPSSRQMYGLFIGGYAMITLGCPGKSQNDPVGAQECITPQYGWQPRAVRAHPRFDLHAARGDPCRRHPDRAGRLVVLVLRGFPRFDYGTECALSTGNVIRYAEAVKLRRFMIGPVRR